MIGEDILRCLSRRANPFGKTPGSCAPPQAIARDLQISSKRRLT
jgi:hypothetical protein